MNKQSRLTRALSLLFAISVASVIIARAGGCAAATPVPATAVAATAPTSTPPPTTVEPTPSPPLPPSAPPDAGPTVALEPVEEFFPATKAGPVFRPRDLQPTSDAEPGAPKQQSAPQPK